MNILIIDDTPSNIDILLEFLDEKFTIFASTNGRDGLEILENEEIDLVLLDIMMPEMDGFQVAQKIREKNDRVPIIFITAKTGDTDIEKAYSVGGNDYITKPFREKEVLARITLHLKLREYEKELEKLAFYDSLTKLYNRRYFDEIIPKLLKIAKRNHKIISIIMLDIDFFKKVNDNYGHLTGDKILQFLSSKLLSLTRESDIVIRFGGEEFIILLPNTEIAGAKKLAEKIRKEIENSVVTTENIKFTISLGVTEIQMGEKTNKFLKRVDDSLYEAKNSGRNKVCIK